MPRKRPAPILEGVVPHPRYGAAPRPSGLVVPEDDIRHGFWGLGQATIFPETVLRADTSVQNFSMYPRDYYVDILRKCRSCNRPFIFSAREQRYWFETLRFYVDADCVDCVDCRRASRSIQRRLRRYSDLFAKDVISRKELMFLVDDAAFLVTHGTLKNLDNVGSVKNRALKMIPEYPGIAALIAAIHAARKQAAKYILIQDLVRDDYTQ